MSTLSVDMIEPVGSTLTLGQSGDTVTIPAGGTFTNNGIATGFASGNTYASQWRLHTNLSCTGAAPGTIAAANWEQPASTEFPGVINSGSLMSVNASTGAWTFPATGVWYITWQITYRNTIHHTTHPYIYGSNNTGGSWVMLTTTRTSQSANWDSSLTVTYLFDCTNTTTDLVRLSVGTDAGSGQSNLFCSGSVNETYATFIKLGDAS
jgi:hypothetical protein